MKMERAEKAAFLTLFASAALAVGMIAVAGITHSVAILGEGLDKCVDLISTVAVIIGLRLSRLHPRNFPNGLYKLENLISVLIGGAILLAAYELAVESIRRVAGGGEAVDRPWLVVATMIGALLINSAIAWYKMKVGREENSPSLIADARNNWTDSLAYCAVIVGVTLEALGVANMDAYTGLVVVLFLAQTGLSVGLDGLKVLLDASVENDVLDKVKAIVDSDRRVRDVISIQGRNSGKYRFLSLYLVPVSYDLRQAEATAAGLKEKIRAEVPNVDQVAIDFSSEERDRLYAAVPLEDDWSTVSPGMGDAVNFELLEIALPGLEVTARERMANPGRDAASGREVRAAVFLARQGAEAVLVRQPMQGNEARFVLEPNGITWLERPEVNSLEQAEGALREYAKAGRTAGGEPEGRERE